MTEETKEQEKIDEITSKAKQELNQDLVDKVLQGGDLDFEYKDVKYRVRKPSFSDKQKVYKEKVRKYSEMIRDKSLMLESDLKAQYKERGVDIDDYQNKINSLEVEKNNFKLKIGEILAGQGVESDADIYKKNIEGIVSQQIELSRKKTQLMEYCLEQQLLVYLYAFLTVLVTDKLIGEKWERVWETYDEFENCPDESLVNRVAFHAGLVMREEISL